MTQQIKMTMGKSFLIPPLRRYIWVVFLYILIPESLSAQEKIIQPDRVEHLMNTKGRVRIIVSLNVQNHKEMSAASATYSPPEHADSKDSPGGNPDQTLAEAISSTADSVTAKLPKGSFNLKRVFRFTPAMAMSVDPPALNALKQHPAVVSIQEDRLSKAFPPNIKPDIKIDEKKSSGVTDTPSLVDSATLIGADRAWAMGYTGSGEYVAVLDTGVKTDHEMFLGKTIVEACYGTTDSYWQSRTICPNGLESQTGAGAAPPTAGSHGTHVSGIAVGNNTDFQTGEPLQGVAPGAGLIAVQVFSRFDSVSVCYPDAPPCYLSFDSDQIGGMEFVYSQRFQYAISSVNMSLGGGEYTSYCDSDSRKPIIDLLKAAKIATVIATGNNGYCDATGAPGCISSAVSVGASDKSDVEAWFNNWNADIQDLFAPGVSILSSTSSTPTSYESWNGTSMATPHVAGAFAILKQANKTASVDTLESALKQTGTPIPGLCYLAGTIPRINVAGALEKVIPSPLPRPNYLNIIPAINLLLSVAR